jgi:hypothetical protein
MYTKEQLPRKHKNCQSHFSGILVSVLVFISLFVSCDGMSQGNILIMPKRVVFEGNKKTQELTLANTGADTAKYVVSIVDYRMNEDGSFETVVTPDSGQFFAGPYLRFFPRTVQLPPNQSQVVKMQLAKSSKMAPGEYRSHVYFRSVPKDVPLGEDPSQKDSLAVTVRLTPVFGITIPSIIRVGECSVKVDIGDVAVEMTNDTIPRLLLTFTRSGNISVYGDIAVNHTSPEGKVTRVAIVKGVAVYTPNIIRKFQCNLDRSPSVDYRKGKLKIVYSTSDDVKASKIAEAEILLH